MSYYQYGGHGGDNYWDTSYDEFYDFEDYNDYFDGQDDYWYDAEQQQYHQGYEDEQGHFDESDHTPYAGDQGQHMEDFDDSFEQDHTLSQQHGGGDRLGNGMGDHDGYIPEDEMHDLSYDGNYHEHMSQQWYRSDSLGQSDREVANPTFMEEEVRGVGHFTSVTTERSATRSFLANMGRKLKINARQPPSIVVSQSPNVAFYSPKSATPSPSSAKELFHSAMWMRSPISIQQSRSLPTSPTNNIPRSHPSCHVATMSNNDSETSWQLDRGLPWPTTWSSNIAGTTQNTGPNLIGNFGFLAPRTP